LFAVGVEQDAHASALSCGLDERIDQGPRDAEPAKCGRHVEMPHERGCIVVHRQSDAAARGSIVVGN